MSWEQTFVIAWTQFALSALIVLCLTHFTLKWVSQPVERTRLISGMLAATLLLPAMSIFSPFPTWRLPLISLWATDSRPDSDVASHNILSAAIILQAHDAGDVQEAGVASSGPVTQLDRTKEPLPGSTNPSLKGASSVAARWTLPDAWTLSAWTILALHALTGVYFVIEQAIGQTRRRRLSLGATNASDAVYSSWTSVVADRGTHVRLLVSSEIGAPLMFGWLRPTIVIPLTVAENVDSELNACLSHEWSHIESGDVLTWHFVNICQLVLWYQPLFWTLRRELRVCQEFLADHKSTREAMTSLEYSELLFRLAKGRRPIRTTGALMMFERPSELAQRIKMLLETPVTMNVHCRWQFTCIMLTLAALLPIAVSSVRVGTIQADDGITTLVEPNAAPEATDLTTEKPPGNLTEPEKVLASEKVDEPQQTQPKWRSVTYTREVTTAGLPTPAVCQEYLAEDGRKRTENGNHTVTIFDDRSRIRLMLMKRLHTAFVYPPSPLLDKMPEKLRESMIGPAQRHLQTIATLCNSDSEKLGQKEVDGKLADGFVATQLGTTYTIWTDTATGDLVRVEYDTTAIGSQMHIAMSDFRFGEKLDDSLFSVDVPDDYKVSTVATVASASDSIEKRAADAPVGMKTVWSNSRKTCRLSSMPAPRGLWTMDFSGKAELLDERGEKQAGFQPQAPQQTGFQFAPCKLIRAADLDGGGKFNLLTVGMVGSAVNAYDTDGKLLWSYAKGDDAGHTWSVNDICAVDLNDDGRDEVIIGFNGFTGLHVLDHQGKNFWKVTSIGNVWHVSAGSVEGDGRPEVVCTSAMGKVHVFSGEGKTLRILDAGIYANMIRTWQPADKSSCVMIVAGTVAKEEKIVAINSHEKQLWSVNLSHRVVSATVCQLKPWLALTLNDGTAYVIDVVTGKEVARVGGQGATTDSAWLPAEQGDPLLVIANQAEINAYRVENGTP